MEIAELIAADKTLEDVSKYCLLANTARFIFNYLILVVQLAHQSNENTFDIFLIVNSYE